VGPLLHLTEPGVDSLTHGGASCKSCTLHSPRPTINLAATPSISCSSCRLLSFPGAVVPPPQPPQPSHLHRTAPYLSPKWGKGCTSASVTNWPAQKSERIGHDSTSVHTAVRVYDPATESVENSKKQAISAGCASYEHAFLAAVRAGTHSAP
jgi:hypothetical protein